MEYLDWLKDMSAKQALRAEQLDNMGEGQKAKLLSTVKDGNALLSMLSKKSARRSA